MDIYAYYEYPWLNCGYPYLDLNTLYLEFTTIVDIHNSIMETIMDIIV